MFNPGILSHDYVLVPETPQAYAKAAVCAFIEQEVRRPSKQWIANIIAGEQESDQVILRTDEFVLLPDTERVNRYWRNQAPEPRVKAASGRPSSTGKAAMMKAPLNWLAIVQDFGVRTLRDLRGCHAPMLRRMLEGCMAAVEKHTSLPRGQVMAYVHYPPSVYQLHVHFSYPYGQYCHRDAYRMHSLEGIINNLEIDPAYYAKATLHLAMYRQSPHHLALTAVPDDDGEKNSE
jgi:hypothetical protein